MSTQSSNSAKAEMPLAAPGSASVDEPGEGLRRLGEALSARTGDVIAGTVARTEASKHGLDEAVEESFRRVGMASTAAVARWMSGQGLGAGGGGGVGTRATLG